MRKIKVGDKVVVIAGRSKGIQGFVKRIVLDKKSRKPYRVTVESVNMNYKHVRPNPNQNVEGGIVKKEAPLAISNVALVNPLTDKADRVGIKCIEGKKVRYFKSNNEVVDVT